MEPFASFVRWIFDLLFPRGELVRKLESMNADQLLETNDRLLLPTCSHNGNGLQKQPVAVFEYKHPLIRQAIWEMKYRRNMKVIALLAKAMADFITEEITEEWQFLGGKKVLLIPIPISSRRKHGRGYNQMEIFCEIIMKELPADVFELETNALVKVRHTLPQTKTKNKRERLGNLKGVFEVADKSRVKGRTIILLDDVTTTGATLKEATGALKKSGARRIYPIAIAH
jgi:competence protein ComFC